MKNLNNYIFEKLNIKDIKSQYKYKYFPKTKNELIKILDERLKDDKDADLNDINVSEITDMSFLFIELDPYNIDISEWNVSNVKDMRFAFASCVNLDCNLSKWDVSNVKDMSHMFYDCQNFNADLSKWDVSNVNDMGDIFYACTSLKNMPSWYKE